MKQIQKNAYLIQNAKSQKKILCETSVDFLDTAQLHANLKIGIKAG